MDQAYAHCGQTGKALIPCGMTILASCSSITSRCSTKTKSMSTTRQRGKLMTSSDAVYGALDEN
jgi:hypothetical protein